MIWLKLIKKLIKALNADASPAEIAAGVVLGSVIGLTPAFALHNIIVIILIIILKVNVASAVFASILFGIIGYLTDPLAYIIGEKVLLAGGLNGLWTALYNIPVVPLTRFNNTVVLGALIIALLLMIPLFIFSQKFVVYYREQLQEKVNKWKIVKIMKASKLYKIYIRFKS
jgi:uncharacterized protein (TIGR03546 family)